ncbi:MAG: YHS domain-containing (seleno)protein [Alphaproteobacteria bacterium]|nr:YHS domain-containing (seleno)protein [Alphaproteobacteria bacterium]
MSTSSPLTSRPAYFLYGAIVIVVAVMAGAMFVSPMLSAKQEFAAYNVDSDNVAIHGYDTVAYFTEGKPMKGKNEFEQVWEDTRWQFASATNRELFKANPERYAPQFGGYCAGGLAVGEYADGDPKLFTIVDGKLYLIKNKEYQTAWRKAPEAAIHFGEYNWGNYRDKLRDNM